MQKINSNHLLKVDGLSVSFVTRNGIIKHPDLFYSTQAIFIEDGLVITRHAYTPAGTITQTVLPIMSLTHDYQRLTKWDENEEGFIQVKLDKPTAKPIQSESDERAHQFLDSLEHMGHDYSTKQKTLLCFQPWAT